MIHSNRCVLASKRILTQRSLSAGARDQENGRGGAGRGGALWSSGNEAARRGVLLSRRGVAWRSRRHCRVPSSSGPSVSQSVSQSLSSRVAGCQLVCPSGRPDHGRLASPRLDSPCRCAAVNREPPRRVVSRVLVVAAWMSSLRVVQCAWIK